MSKYSYGLVVDKPDGRDLLFTAPPIRSIADLPESVDWRRTLPTAWDQGLIGSCQGHGTGRAFLNLLNRRSKSGVTKLRPSRLGIYYQSRVLEGTVAEDAGSMIRDGFKVCAQFGVSDEKWWPYDIRAFADAPKPSAVHSARMHRAAGYQRVTSAPDMLSALAHGMVVSLGFTVYESFETDEVANTGVMPVPEAGERELGGHCVAAVGYDQAKRALLCTNSWGTEWGINGSFWMPFSIPFMDAWTFVS